MLMSRASRPRPRVTLRGEAVGDGSVRVAGIRLTPDEARAHVEQIQQLVAHRDPGPTIDITDTAIELCGHSLNETRARQLATELVDAIETLTVRRLR